MLSCFNHHSAERKKKIFWKPLKNNQCPLLCADKLVTPGSIDLSQRKLSIFLSVIAFNSLFLDLYCFVMNGAILKLGYVIELNRSSCVYLNFQKAAESSGTMLGQ